MDRAELPAHSSAEVRIRYSGEDVLATLHAREPKAAYLTYYRGASRYRHFLSDEDVSGLVLNGANIINSRIAVHALE